MTRKPTACHHEEREREDDARRIPTAQPSPLEGRDGRVQRARQDDGDEDPGQHLPGEVDERKEQAHENRDSENREDGRGSDQDHARLGGQDR